MYLSYISWSYSSAFFSDQLSVDVRIQLDLFFNSYFFFFFFLKKIGFLSVIDKMYRCNTSKHIKILTYVHEYDSIRFSNVQKIVKNCESVPVSYRY